MTEDAKVRKARIELSTQLDVPPDPPVLAAIGMLGQAEISRPFVYTVSMLSRNFGITADQMLGTKVGLRIRREGEPQPRSFSGFVAAFSGGPLHPKRRELRTYAMRVVPWLALLDQGAKFRIFEEMDVLQVIAAVLKGAIEDMFGAAAQSGLYFRLDIQSRPDTFPLLEYCVQYEETDFAFVSRLMEKHGIHYFFEETDTNHTMVIVEGPPYRVVEDSPFSFHASPDSRGGEIGHWTHGFAPRLRHWSLRDRDYRSNPAVLEGGEGTVIPEVEKSTQGDHEEFPGAVAGLKDPGEETRYARTLARVRVQEEETRFETFTGNTLSTRLAPGRRLKIIGVAEQKDFERIRGEEEKEYLITSVTFSVVDGAITDDRPAEIVNKLMHAAFMGAWGGVGEKLGDTWKDHQPSVNKTINELPKIEKLLSAFGFGFAGPWVAYLADLGSPVLSEVPIIGPLFKRHHPPPYTNSFTAVPLLPGRVYRSPSRTPRPRVRGPQTAIVFGQTEGDVETDELGRVRVKFDWDRTTPKDKAPETRSCFLRVVQGWAGPGLGHQFLPRVGEEVLVEFIDGDPDRPLITGRVYSKAHKTPFELSKHRLLSGIKTRTVPLEDGAKDLFNMLRFDDAAGSQQVLIRSQRRFDLRAYGAIYETNSGSRHTHIGWKDPDSDKQGGDYDITVGNDYQLHIQGGHYQRIEKPLNLTSVGAVVQDFQADETAMVKNTLGLNAARIVLEAKQKISLKVGGSSIVLDPSGVTIVGTQVKINSGGSGDEVRDADIEDPVDAAVSDTGEPGWREKHRGGSGGGRRKRHLSAQHYTAPPRPGEPPQVTALRNRLNNTPTGREAMHIYDRNNVTPVIGAPGGGTFFTPPDGRGGGNTVTLDPTSPISASDFAHEMVHADEWGSGRAPDINTMSRNDYVNRKLDTEAHGEAVGERAHQELAAAGDPEPGTRNPFTGPVYDNAAATGEAAHRAANPNASRVDIEEAGRRAGEQAVRNSFQSGNVITSNNGQSYPQYYGDAWDRAHPPPPPRP